MAIGDVWELSLGFEDAVAAKGNSTAVHLEEGSGGPPDHAELHAEAVQWFDAGYTAIAAAKTNFPSTLTFAQTTLRRMVPLSAFIPVLTTSLPIAGTAGPDPIGSGASALLSLRTVLKGRSFRGRQYLPAVAETAVAGGLIPAAPAGVFANGWASMLAAMLLTTNFPAPVVWSRVLSLTTSITEVRADRRPRSQRRRQVSEGLYVVGVPA